MSDEDLARRLQEEFDREADTYREMQKEDHALACRVAKAHSISDSDDSDSTSDVYIKASPNGSRDLFEDGQDEVTSTPHQKAKLPSPQGSQTSKKSKGSPLQQPKSKGSPLQQPKSKGSPLQQPKSKGSPLQQPKSKGSLLDPPKSKADKSADPYNADTDVEEDIEEEVKKAAAKPLCKYGRTCYRKNPSHWEEFFHPSKRRRNEGTDNEVPQKVFKADKETRKDEKTPMDAFNEFQPLGLFLTKVKNIPSKFNSTGAMSLQDILSKSLGELKASCHFNFMFDIPWLVRQYPEEYRNLPILLVHGEQGRAELDMKAEAQPFSNITLSRASLDIPYGTHHTKMMLLLYRSGLRVVIHTANLIQNDWHQKTQGIWISPVFPPLTSPNVKGDSPTGFKTDLLQYFLAYKSAKLAVWERHIQAHDMTLANVHLIGSVPGRHTLNSKHYWGHLKLKKILSERGPDLGLVRNWSVVGQFSSIGSLGPSKEAWLLSEFGQSLSACKNGSGGLVPASKLDLIFPSKDNIRLSLEGYNGGGCVPYSIKTASKQPWLTGMFCQWVSEGRGRSKAVPHIKTYTRFSPDGSQAAWFLVTSANLSKAAWGVLEKKGEQFMIRSYELGVLFLPQSFGCKNAFPVTSRAEDVAATDKPVLPLPYDLPPTTYVKGDRPWFCDVPCMDLPDTFGKMWCPPL